MIWSLFFFFLSKNKNGCLTWVWVIRRKRPRNDSECREKNELKWENIVKTCKNKYNLIYPLKSLDGLIDITKLNSLNFFLTWLIKSYLLTWYCMNDNKFKTFSNGANYIVSSIINYLFIPSKVTLKFSHF